VSEEILPRGSWIAAYVIFCTHIRNRPEELGCVMKLFHEFWGARRKRSRKGVCGCELGVWWRDVSYFFEAGGMD